MPGQILLQRPSIQYCIGGFDPAITAITEYEVNEAESRSCMSLDISRLFFNLTLILFSEEYFPSSIVDRIRGWSSNFPIDDVK